MTGPSQTDLEDSKPRTDLAQRKLKWGIGSTKSSVTCDIIGYSASVAHLGFGAAEDNVEAPVDGDSYILGDADVTLHITPELYKYS